MGVRKILFASVVCLFWATAVYASDVTDSSYFPGPDDVLVVSVWKEEALKNEVVVRPDGKISVPLVGDILVQGRSVEEVRQEIQTKMDEFSPGAPVSVMVTKVLSPKVYVVGKVLRPGMFLMPENMTVMQALALAGGFTPFAARGDILVLHEARGKTQSLPFDFDAVAKGKALEQNIYLNRGDTVVVP